MCTSCIQYGTQLDHIYHTHFGSYTDDLKAFIAKHYGEVPRDTDCICKSHYLEAKCYWSNESYLPKWKEREIHSNKFCSYPKCITPHDKVMTPAFTNEQTIKGILRLTTDEPIILCKAHYIITSPCTEKWENRLPPLVPVVVQNLSMGPCLPGIALTPKWFKSTCA